MRTAESPMPRPWTLSLHLPCLSPLFHCSNSYLPFEATLSATSFSHAHSARSPLPSELAKVPGSGCLALKFHMPLVLNHELHTWNTSFPPRGFFRLSPGRVEKGPPGKVCRVNKYPSPWTEALLWPHQAKCMVRSPSGVC